MRLDRFRRFEGKEKGVAHALILQSLMACRWSFALLLSFQVFNGTGNGVKNM
jgi:hypothetical protein